MSLVRGSLTLLRVAGIRPVFAAPFSIKFTDMNLVLKEKRLKRTRPVAAYLLDLSASPSEILSRLTPHDATRLQKIQEEHRNRLSAGEEIPSTLDDKALVELLRVNTWHHRSRVFSRVLKKMWGREDKARKQAEKAAAKAARAADSPAVAAEAVMGIPKVVRHIPKMSIKSLHYARAFREMEFAQKLILDLTFEEEMRLEDEKSLCRQVLESTGAVLRERDTLHLVFSGMRRNSNQLAFLARLLQMPTPDCFDELPFSRTESCVLTDMTPAQRRRVVYLSPHSHRRMRGWDHSCTYVIGGLVDKVDTSPFTLLKAKQLGIRHARLPLDEFLDWKKCHKSLTINVVMNILLTLRRTGDFRKAFEHIPRRMLTEHDPMRRQLRFQ